MASAQQNHILALELFSYLQEEIGEAQKAFSDLTGNGKGSRADILRELRDIRPIIFELIDLLEQDLPFELISIQPRPTEDWMARLNNNPCGFSQRRDLAAGISGRTKNIKWLDVLKWMHDHLGNNSSG
jgi:hypothetical protein